MNTSLKDINNLTSIAALKKRAQGLALLDAIISPQWEYRYFSFDSDWDESCNEVMASMRDGSGSEYFLLFSSHGAIGKVFTGEVLVSNSEIHSGIPIEFSNFTNEKAFSMSNATFVFWRSSLSSFWSVLPGNLLSFPLLGFLFGDASVYVSYASHVHGIIIDHELVSSVFDYLAVTPLQLKGMNPQLTVEDLAEDIGEIFGTRTL